MYKNCKVYVCLPAYKHRSACIPGDSRCSATKRRGTSNAQHRRHSPLWELFKEEEDVSQQDANWRGSQTNRSLQTPNGRWWIPSPFLTSLSICPPQACPCTTHRCASLWTTSSGTWIRKWVAAWCWPASRCSTKSQRTWLRKYLPYSWIF